MNTNEHVILIAVRDTCGLVVPVIVSLLINNCTVHHIILQLQILLLIVPKERMQIQKSVVLVSDRQNKQIQNTH